MTRAHTDSTSALHRVPVRESNKHAINSASLLAIVAVVVGAWVVKALQHPNVQQMGQVCHYFQSVDLQRGLQPLGREEVLIDTKVT